MKPSALRWSAAVALATLPMSCAASHDSDVKIASCARSFGQAVASLRITNPGSDAADYFVTVAFTGADGTSGEGFTGDVEVGAGTTVAKDVSPAGGAGPGAFSCKVSRVDVE